MPLPASPLCVPNVTSMVGAAEAAETSHSPSRVAWNIASPEPFFAVPVKGTCVRQTPVMLVQCSRQPGRVARPSSAAIRL
jgi:hypothetical protein